MRDGRGGQNLRTNVQRLVYFPSRVTPIVSTQLNSPKHISEHNNIIIVTVPLAENIEENIHVSIYVS